MTDNLLSSCGVSGRRSVAQRGYTLSIGEGRRGSDLVCDNGRDWGKFRDFTDDQFIEHSEKMQIRARYGTSGEQINQSTAAGLIYIQVGSTHPTHPTKGLEGPSSCLVLDLLALTIELSAGMRSERGSSVRDI